MSKIAIIGDTHIGVRNDSEHFANFQLNWFSWFFEYCEENGITDIIQLGDLHDRRRYTNFSTIAKFSPVFKKLEKYNTVVISGNHDCYYKSTNEVNSVKILLELYNIKVISEVPETVTLAGEKIDFFPWISPSNYQNTLDFIAKTKSKFACGHFEFSKFEMHAGHLAESGMDHTLFSKYDRVYSGHYHTMSAKDNILYTGIPYELDWSDHGDTKGFWIHDKKNPVMVPSPNTMYEKIFYNEEDNPTPPEATGKIVKVFAVNKKNQFNFDRFVDAVLQSNPYDLKVVDNTVYETEEGESVDNLESLSTVEIISSTVDAISTDLDKNKLKTLMNELYVEAVQVMQE